MNPYILVLIIAACVIFAAWYGLRLRKKDTPKLHTAVPLPAAWTWAGLSPGGISVQGVRTVPLEALMRLDAGITAQLVRTHIAKPNWAQKRDLSTYKIGFIDPMATNQVNDPGSPALIVTDGLGHATQAAGTCLGVANDGVSPDLIILPHQADSNWQFLDYLQESARNESEHIAEWFNDPALFYSFLGAGDVHPHFP